MQNITINTGNYTLNMFIGVGILFWFEHPCWVWFFMFLWLWENMPYNTLTILLEMWEGLLLWLRPTNTV